MYYRQIRTFTKRDEITRRYQIEGFGYVQKLIINIRDDGKCQFPGCNNEKHNIHHIVPRNYAHYILGWSISNINDITNGILLCRKHHNFIHEGYQKKNPPWNTIWDRYFKKTIEDNAIQHNLQSIICA